MKYSLSTDINDEVWLDTVKYVDGGYGIRLGDHSSNADILLKNKSDLEKIIDLLTTLKNQ